MKKMGGRLEVRMVACKHQRRWGKAKGVDDVVARGPNDGVTVTERRWHHGRMWAGIRHQSSWGAAAVVTYGRTGSTAGSWGVWTAT